MFFAAAVVNEDGARDYRGRSYAVVFLDDGLCVVRRQHFEGGTLRGPRQGVSILPHVEWAVCSMRSPVIADRLGYSEDVRFGEGAVQGRAAVSAGTEAD